jgi:hypothetical protein
LPLRSTTSAGATAGFTTASYVPPSTSGSRGCTTAVRTLPETQSTGAPLPERHARSTGGYVPALGTQMNVLADVTWCTISLNETVIDPSRVSGSANTADGGVASGVGMVTGSNESASYQSTSTHPSIPGIVPQLPYCQKVHPFPPQSPAGTVGVDTAQCATHSTV